VFATNSYSQMEFSSAKFKAIPPLDTGIKTKKVTQQQLPTEIF
jgi:hypothetical protein